MQKFEYEVLTYGERNGEHGWFSTRGKAGSNEQLPALLNAYGRQGWEVAAGAALGERFYQIVLKRAVPARM